jgi:hypothetical protein
MTSAPPGILLAVTAREVVDYYFHAPTASFAYKCKKCERMMRQKKNSGFSNLRNHLTSCVGKNFEMELQQLLAHSNPTTSSSSQTRVQQYFQPIYSSREVDVYKWIEWVVMRHKPLSKVDDSLTREGMKYSAVTSKSIKKYILQLTPLIEAKIWDELAGIVFAITLDGWTEGSTHYVAVFAVYMKNGKAKETMLSCAPIEISANDPVRFGADEHMKYLNATLSAFVDAYEEAIYYLQPGLGKNIFIGNILQYIAIYI